MHGHLNSPGDTPRGLIVQLAGRMEDPRMQHPLMQVPDVDTKPLPALLAARPELRPVLLDALQTVRGAAITQPVRAGAVYFEISMLEGVAGASNLLGRVPVDRILFGSHFPLFILESARRKPRESELSPTGTNPIRRLNARRLPKTTHGQ